MRTFTVIVEKSPDTGLYVGYVPGLHGAHSQAESLDELRTNLKEVIEMLLEDGEPTLETEIVKRADDPCGKNGAGLCKTGVNSTKVPKYIAAAAHEFQIVVHGPNSFVNI